MVQLELDAEAHFMTNLYANYTRSLSEQLAAFDWQPVEELAQRLYQLWQRRGRLFIAGNGGSAANAVHLANDFLYGVNPSGRSIDVEALSANSAVLTCLGNDIGYQNIFAQQLAVKGQQDDVLIVLSGSGNSPNILEALKTAKQKGVYSVGILGYSGGQAKSACDLPLHFAIDDMQIAEDTQIIIGHMLMRRLHGLLAEHGAD